jgi:hypothetical protein
MHLDTVANDLAGAQTSVRLLDVPDVCPRCHRSVHPKNLACAHLPERDLCQTIFRCTHQKCQELFVGTYTSTHRLPGGRSEYALQTIAPLAAQNASFPETVTTLSPMFVAIFNQSVEAESRQLDQLVGIGLRKALEFLIKDYAVFENPGSEDAIRKALLSACIAQYVTDQNVKECAKRAAWLGNDETHYTRKWETKDVNDLRLLVRLTVNWIDNSLLTKKYMTDMSAGKV